MRTVLLCLVILGCAGCRGGDRKPVSGVADAALPVVGPMAARERLLHDLGQQKQLATEREQAFDAIHDDR